MADEAERLAEVPEHAATGALAAIYEDIKRQLQAPMVNLVYRHLATVPGGLEWAWASIRPVIVDGTVARAAQHLADAAQRQPLPELPVTALRALGVDREAERQITDILGAYNRANPRNLVSVCCLLLLLERGDEHGGGLPVPKLRGTGTDGSPGVVPRLPAMIDPREMDATTAALVADFSGHRRDGDRVIVPSLFRHLARWPQFLAVAWTLLRPLAASGVIEAAADDVAQRAHAVARQITADADGRLPRLRLPSPDTRPQLAHQLATFVPTISTMVEIGALLSRSVPAPLP